MNQNLCDSGNPRRFSLFGERSNKGETITMAPLIVKGRVLVGNSGGEMGVRGWVTALDENTGASVWRAYATGPDADVLIGANFKPFYDSLKGKDLGVKSWPPEGCAAGVLQAPARRITESAGCP